MTSRGGNQFAGRKNIHAHTIWRDKGMSPWKNHVVLLTMALLSLSFAIFLAAGYTALYWAWLRADLQTAMPYLPWARSFGMLAMACAAVALGILFSSKIFPLPP